jgi:hypothetical protein
MTRQRFAKDRRAVASGMRITVALQLPPIEQPTMTRLAHHTNKLVDGKLLRAVGDRPTRARHRDASNDDAFSFRDTGRVARDPVDPTA